MAAANPIPSEFGDPDCAHFLAPCYVQVLGYTPDGVVLEAEAANIKNGR